MKKIILAAALAACMTPAISAQDTDTELLSITVGNFDAPGTEEAKEGAGSAWERAPFNWYYKYSGMQLIYTADYLEQLAADNGIIKEVVFKYGDEGSFVQVDATLNLLIENTDFTEFEKKPETQQYMWVTYDPSTASSTVEYSIELYYMEDEEIHMVLDKPLQYEGKSLLITLWSEVTNDVEAMATVTYAMRTAGYTSMPFGSDRYPFEKIYDTGVQESGQSPNKNVPVVKFMYTQGDGIASPAVDTAAPVLYNLQGQPVEGQPAPGLYIRRQGTQATKVVVK